MRRLTAATAAIAVLSIAISMTSALAAVGTVPMCDWSGSSEGAAAQDLIQRLNLQAKPSVMASRATGGCFKVEYVEDGMFVTEYYDPDSTRPLTAE